MFAWWFAAAGCDPKFAEEELAGARHLYTRLTSNVKGTASVKVPFYAQETAFLATVTTEAPNAAHFRSVRDTNDAPVFEAFAWNDSPYSKTNAGFVADVVSLNWPIQADDPTVFPGKWAFEIGVVDANKNYIAAPITLDLLVKDDPDFEAGALDVSVVYAGGLERDDALWAAVEEAKLQWVDLYAAMGIDVSFTSYAYAPGDLGAPAFGDETAYVDIANDTAPRSVNLVISDEIAGYSDIYGIAGDIPGPLIPTTRSAVQVSASLAAGTDWEFTPEEVRLLAETMAHEVGHYLGLYHPVEIEWGAWDVLPDTPECQSEEECIDELGANLMFPYPVCGPASCTPQDDLTQEQAAVANRYTATW
ncbi:MAG: hypothetical protein ABMA64_10580 [Myxococcota bacterium]